jgi:non-homologous end joining protein Ku
LIPKVRNEKEFFAHSVTTDQQGVGFPCLAHHGNQRRGKFKDEYETVLRKLVQRKAKEHTIEVPESQERPSNVINLMDALRESLKTNSNRGSHVRCEAEETSIQSPPP